MKLLLDSRANPFAVDSNGPMLKVCPGKPPVLHDPSGSQTRQQRASLRRWLRPQGAPGISPQGPDATSRSSHVLCCFFGQVGINVNQRNAQGQTPLAVAQLNKQEAGAGV